MQLNTLFTVGKCFTKERSEITSMTLYHDGERKNSIESNGSETNGNKWQEITSREK